MSSEKQNYNYTHYAVIANLIFYVVDKTDEAEKLS
jgi:hypothetical protein